MKRIWAVAEKELRQIARDPFSLLMLLGIPTFMLLLYGYALSFDVKHIALAVEDGSKDAASREVVSAFLRSTYFDRVADVPPGGDAAALLARGRAKAVLVIPERLAADVARGDATVQLLVDGTDANTGSTVLSYAAAAVGDAGRRLRAASTGEPAPVPRISLSTRVWYNPELKSTQFIVPGLIGFILMLTAVLSTALSVVREKERGTMERLRISGLRPSHLVLGKTLPYLAISLLATALIVIASRLLFDVRVRGSYLDLLVAVLIYLMGALGLGLLVSSISISQSMAFQVGSVLSILPAIFLSGFIFPIDAMPRALQVVTYVFPARYFLVILRGVVLKGAPLSTYPADLFFLVLYAAAVLSLAWARLVRREA